MLCNCRRIEIGTFKQLRMLFSALFHQNANIQPSRDCFTAELLQWVTMEQELATPDEDLIMGCQSELMPKDAAQVVFAAAMGLGKNR